MSDVGDDELLNENDEEFDYESYDITCEKEEALLQDEDYGEHLRDDEDYHQQGNTRNLDKKQSVSENDEPEEDVLNLDIEEDFQEVDDKGTFEEEDSQDKRKDGKFAVERAPVTSSSASTKQTSQKMIAAIKPKPTVNKSGTTKLQTIKKVPPKVDNKRRRGNGRGNFQSRPNFPRNNIPKERRLERKKTVFINPKYEGIVHINDNNARLAWDNANFQQHNPPFVQPWASGNGLGNCEVNFQDPSPLISLVSELANISQTSSNLFQMGPAVPQLQNQNFFPPQNTYQPEPMYQPPPLQNSQTYGNQNQHIPQWDNSYNMVNQNQVSLRQTYPSTSVQSYQGMGSQEFHHPVDELQESYTSYDYYDNRSTNQQNYSLDFKKNFYENRNLNYNRTMKENDYEVNKNNTYNKITFSRLGDNQNRNENYANDGYQKRSYNNNFSKQRDYNIQRVNYNTNSYDSRSSNRNSEVGYNNKRVNTYANRTLTKIEGSKQGDSPNTSEDWRNSSDNYCKNINNQNRSKVTTNKASDKPDNNVIQKRNIVGQNVRRPALNETVDNKQMPEKKMKMEDNVNKTVENKKDEQVKQQASNNKTLKEVEEDEDEEMRLYKLKIEEQKRQREKVLKMKEERRKMMLQQKAEEEKAKSATAAPAPVPQQLPAPVSSQKQNIQRRPPPRQKPNYHQHPSNNIPVISVPNQSQYFGNSNTESSAEDEMSNLTFKVSNDLQKTTPISSNLPKTEPSSNTFMSNRVVVVKNSNPKSEVLQNSNVVKTVQVSNDAYNESADVRQQQQLSSFFNNRKVLKKDNSLINTRLVVVNNLAASTDSNKLVAMTRGIGEIQKLRMDKQERQATILFKSVASAHAFFKKYQRHILDLSVIEVKLQPML